MPLAGLGKLVAAGTFGPGWLISSGAGGWNGRAGVRDCNMKQCCLADTLQGVDASLNPMVIWSGSTMEARVTTGLSLGLLA